MAIGLRVENTEDRADSVSSSGVSAALPYGSGSSTFVTATGPLGLAASLAGLIRNFRLDELRQKVE